MAAIASDYYHAAKLYETCRKEAEKADEDLQKIETLRTDLEENYPSFKEHYPNTKDSDLAQTLFKDRNFRLEMRNNFEEWGQKEASEEDVGIRKRRFSSMCREFEKVCLSPVFVQFRTAKDAFQRKTVERIYQGASFEELQKELGDLPNAIRKASDVYQEIRPPAEESRSPREEKESGSYF